MASLMKQESSPLKLPEFEAFEHNKFLHMRFNPYVSFWGAAIIWAFIIFSISRQKDAYDEFTDWSAWIGDEWTWLYIGSQDVWVFVLVYIMCTKYGNIKLGKDDEEPEFTRFQWFSMLFAAGVGVGLFYYGVAEPVWHYTNGAARWSHYNDNDKAQHAIMVTIFHWGVHGWIPYTTIGALLGVICFRRGYPMTIRSCFVPLLGDDVLRGLLGDVIDVLCICATLFGVCTSLGLGVMQLNNAVTRLDKGSYHGVNSRENGRLDIQETKRTQIIIIWVVTLCATISVITGVKGGILTLSLIVFTVGCFLLFSILFMGDTILVLNSLVSVFGYYLWYLPKISFATDAWEMEGAPDGQGGSSTWLSGWTIFYWGWWISWGPFVGTFIAKISRGRTLREFIFWTLLIPTAYCWLWFGILGTEGIRLERQSQKQSIECGCDPTAADATCRYDTYGPLKSTRLKAYGWEAKNQQSYEVKLSCFGTEAMLFEAMGSYGSRTFAYFAVGLTSVCLLFYFVTSSDSGSLVIDSLAANGDEDPPILQRIFWAFTEGAAATALLDAGKTRALTSLQSVSIVSGLPLTFILCYLCYALYLLCLEESGEIDVNRNRLRTNLFFPSTTVGKDGVGAGVVNFLINAICPAVPMAKSSVVIKALSLAKDHTLPSASTFRPDWATIANTLIFYASLASLAASPVESALRKVAGCLYLFFTLGVALQRNKMREIVRVTRGDILTDWLAATLAYPLVLAQNLAELQMGLIPVSVADEKKMASKSLEVDESKEVNDDVAVVDAVVTDGPEKA